MSRVQLISQLAILFFCAGVESHAQTNTNDRPLTERQQESPEATSLFGKPLIRIRLSDTQTRALEEALKEALENYEQNHADIENIIWYGRRLAYLWRYQDAVEVFSSGIALHPNEPRLYRHRGHRWITLRKFDNAIKDFEKALDLIKVHDIPDEMEPDGQPNAAGIPTSSLYTNIYYHLGLAYYLIGHFERAVTNFELCLKYADNRTMQVATLDWLYMAYRKNEEHDKATELLTTVSADWEIIENHAYFRRLLMYKGELNPDRLLTNSDSEDESLTDLDLATYGYGLGNWYLLNGESEQARLMFERVLRGKYWSAFGYIASESELLRLKIQAEENNELAHD